MLMHITCTVHSAKLSGGLLLSSGYVLFLMSWGRQVRSIEFMGCLRKHWEVRHCRNQWYFGDVILSMNFICVIRLQPNVSSSELFMHVHGKSKLAWVHKLVIGIVEV